MVVCGVVLDEADEPALKKLGVRDSKMLSPGQRAKLKKDIERVAKGIYISTISPEQIDGREVNLNRLETLRFAEIINRASAAHKLDMVVIDTPDTNLEKFRAFLPRLLAEKSLNIVAEHYADKNHVSCSVASIVAKVTRDGEIERLKKEYGDFGSGYPSDPYCIGWLEKWADKHHKLPPIVRHSWETIKNLKGRKAQRTLRTFAKQI